MNKKGFTLIELLAIISILAIILLIAVPAVTNVIETSKKKSFNNTALSVLKAANFTYDLKKLNGEISDDIFIDFDNKKIDSYFMLKGNYPNGNLTIDIDGVVIFNINNGDYCAIKEEADTIKVIKYNEEECNLNGEKKPNAPVLADGMIPIKWDGSNVVETTKDDPDWYDYSSDIKKWANAKTADGSMWVWIPRYAYQITNGYHIAARDGTIDVKFIYKATNETLDDITAKAVNQGSNCLDDSDICSRDEFVVHPAFKFGETELLGIWVSKFEMSNTTNQPKSLPNVPPLVSLKVDTIFTTVRNMKTNSSYGWGNSGDGIDTHMMKDIEWGAAAYLAQSEYGKNNEIAKNNNNLTGYGIGFDSKYNTESGKNASTTGNYYGIYDMNGGVYEFTAAYANNNNQNLTKNGESLYIADLKYKDVYSSEINESHTANYAANSGYYGNAVYETSSASSGTTSGWNGNYVRFPSNSFVFSNRGGYKADVDIISGPFNIFTSGGEANNLFGFRSVLLVQPKL